MLIVETSDAAPTLVVMTLHGYGMRASYLAPFASSLRVPARFLYPEGGVRVDGNGRAWWPRIARHPAPVPGRAGFIRPSGSLEARAQVSAWLEDPDLVPPGAAVVLAGFSQGGMLAADVALLGGRRLAGLALFSSAAIAVEEWRPQLHRLRGMPVLLAHGRHDDALAFECGLGLRDLCTEAEAGLEFVDFDGGHQMPLPVWRGFRRLLARLATDPGAGRG